MPVEIIGDIGSCHMGRIEYAKESIDVAKQCGLDKIKFQLFKKLPPNIELPYDWMHPLVEYGEQIGIEVFASVFSTNAMNSLVESGSKSVKISYSHRRKIFPPVLKKLFENLYISEDIMDSNIYGSSCKRLYCIPEYPVKYEISFDGIFPLFDGFSDHTLGFRQTLKAVKAGAKIIEKHFTLDHSDINCPDNNFALKPKELKEMAKAIREIE